MLNAPLHVERCARVFAFVARKWKQARREPHLLPSGRTRIKRKVAKRRRLRSRRFYECGEAPASECGIYGLNFHTQRR